jgi:hypothetical protein
MMGRFYVFSFCLFSFLLRPSLTGYRLVMCFLMILVLGEHLGGDGATRTHWGGGGGGSVGAGNPLGWALELTCGGTKPHHKGLKFFLTSL